MGSESGRGPMRTLSEGEERGALKNPPPYTRMEKHSL
jgi:hypothetical protein